MNTVSRLKWGKYLTSQLAMLINASFIKTSYIHQNRQLYGKLNIYIYIKDFF